jgi:hypothetical protein
MGLTISANVCSYLMGESVIYLIVEGRKEGIE